MNTKKYCDCGDSFSCYRCKLLVHNVLFSMIMDVDRNIRFPTASLGNNFLHLSVASGCSTASIKKIHKAWPLLLHKRNAFGHTPLHSAIQCNCSLDSVKALLECGSDVNVRDCRGETPLHTASCHGRIDMFRILLKYGADINARSNNEQTVLELSLSNEKVQVDAIHFLLTNGADTNVKDGKENSVLRAAGENSSVTLDMFKMLLEWGAVPSVEDLDDKMRLPFSKLLIQYIVILAPQFYFCIQGFPFAALSHEILDLTYFRLMSCTEDVSDYVSLSTFRDTCVKEIIEMQKDKISHNCTLFTFVREWCRKGTSNNIDMNPSLVREVLFRLKIGRYVSCKDLLYASLKRSFVLAELGELDIHTKTVCEDCSEERKVNLNYYTILKLATYLPRDDLVNLAVAYMPSSRKSEQISFMPHKRKPEDTLELFASMKRLKF